MLIEIDDLGCDLVAGVVTRYVPGRADMIEDSFTDHNIFVLQGCIVRSGIISGHGSTLPKKMIYFRRSILNVG
ncbi:hypothetical protein IE4872_CH01758 [Rhizobium gallicum]|uniref:Uncharacterized protein n=1 Tax=Rhizobium gallicum TaxID=56730 RepID=A0A1L5NHQ6_9HYPH|nr:hypothetical protein IE4872_CH01758 [Rhizobium gallicum]